MRSFLALLTLCACADRAADPKDTAETAANDVPDGASLPLGLPATEAGATVAGAAVVDLTPEIREGFTDTNGNHLFDGCFDDATATREGCDEPWDDVDGDGVFDAVFIGGFSPLRPANSVRAPVTARSVVLEDGGSYLALVVLDFVGVTSVRIEAATDILEAEDGWERDRLVVMSTHNHQGPDTMGLWGNPEACLVPGDPQCRSGFDPIFQDRIVQGIVTAVRTAAEAARPVRLRVGALNMRDRSPYFNGSVFGGVNPTPKMHGMVHDIRDPVVVSDQVLAIQGRNPDDPSDVVFTLTSWSGHPEVRSGDNNEISADFVGVARDVIERTWGGIAVHMPESLGGMQSALGGNLPLVTEDGVHVYATCTADDLAEPVTPDCKGKIVGEALTYTDRPPLAVPVWAEKKSWEFVVSHGWHIAEAVQAALDAGEDTSADPLLSASEQGWVPVRNLAYNILGPKGIFDLGLDQGTLDPALCPEASEVPLGCIPFRVFRIQVGPVGFATAPGELLPELSWGLPTDDPAWQREVADPTARGPGSTYFPQHDPACNDVGFEACKGATGAVQGCNCLSIHRWPYILSDDPDHHPVLDDLDTPYRAAISMTSTYLSYVVPEPDVNTGVSLLSDDGDHYEDTVTPAYDFGSLYLDAWGRLQAGWPPR